MSVQSARVVSPQPWRLNYVIHKLTEVEADRKRCQLSNSVHLFNRSASCGKRATWSRNLELDLGPCTRKCARIVEINTRGVVYAVNLYDRAPCLTVSVWRHRQHTNNHADLFLVTIVHVCADTPHILQTHVSPTVQMLPRRHLVLDLRPFGHAVGPRCMIFHAYVAIASGLCILLRSKIS